MCCHTHADVTKENVAFHERERCRCPNGEICQRRATQEDLLCDTCRNGNSLIARQPAMLERLSYLLDEAQKWGGGSG